MPTRRRARRLTVALCLLIGGVGLAYPQYSQSRDGSNCRACHGDFRALAYTSRADGLPWGNLHDLHRNTMLNGDCNTCHASGRFPVFMASSSGGNGLAAISCMGCHGRAADDVSANPEVTAGRGVYGFLDGPSLNSTRRIAAYPSAGSAGVGLMALATGNIGLFGIADTSAQTHEVHACTLAAYMDAFSEAANHPWPLSLQACPVVYRGGAETVAIARVAGGFGVLERGAEKQTIRYVPLIVSGTGSAQTVAAGVEEVLAEAPYAAFVESMTDYGDDLLLVVRKTLGRTVERAHRK